MDDDKDGELALLRFGARVALALVLIGVGGAAFVIGVMVGCGN